MSVCEHCKETTKELHRTFLLLLVERQKNELYRQIIEQRFNLSITPDNSVGELINSINDRIFVNQEAPLQISEPAQGKQQHSIKQKRVFKSAPKAIITEDEENHENIKEIESRILAENIKLFGEYDVQINQDNIENNLRQLKEAKTTKDCTTILTEIKAQRQFLQLVFSPADYGTFIIEHIDRIKRILSENEVVSKKIDAKKMSSLISRILTTLEQRIILHTGFQNQTLDTDEISRYRQCLVLSAKHPKTYRTFVGQPFYDYFTNYAMALFSVHDMFELYVANPYGFKNLCFSRFGNDNDYAFYHLEKYDGTTRYWTMDCRLETISVKLAEITRTYCTMLFRKIYKTCFGTNDYVEGYRTKFPVLEFDCEQLLRNILLTVNTSTFGKTLREIVRRNCTINPTANDKFSSQSDNEEQAISFRRYELVDADIVSVIEPLFDNIKESQCLEIYKTFIQTR